MRMYPAAVLLSVAILPPLARAETSVPLVTPTDGMVLTKDTTLQPGVYHLPRGIVLGADGVTLDGNGATLIGDGTGQGVLSKGRNNITVKNLRVSTYRWGVRLEGGKDASVRGCHIRDTAEVEPPDGVWLNIWARPEEAYGAAIILLDIEGGTVAENDLQHQQNGVSLYGCTGVTVEKNNASFQSGWGIHLFDSRRNIIQDNLADWCNRIHKRGETNYYPGADAAGLLMIWDSSNNIIRRNMFRGGGDGVFVAGYHPEYGKRPCDDNLFEDNDGSYSPNNAFESTFCRGNVFRNNRANASNYGFWLGFSWENQLIGNTVDRNRIAGIAIEHGHHNEINGNRITSNARGIALWARTETAFSTAWPEHRASAFNDIRGNTIAANGVGLLSQRSAGAWWRERTEPAGKASESAADKAARPHDDTVRDNTFYGNEIGGLLMSTDNMTLEGNLFQASTLEGLRLEDSRTARATRNTFTDNPIHAWSDVPVAWTGNRAEGGTPEGNYWGGATGSFAPSGPDAGVDTAPLAEPLMRPDRALPTERGLLRQTPR